MAKRPTVKQDVDNIPCKATQRPRRGLGAAKYDWPSWFRGPLVPTPQLRAFFSRSRPKKGQKSPLVIPRPLSKITRNLTLNQQRLVVQTFFGSLIDFSQKVRKISEVAQLLGLNYNTTRMVLVRFVQRGYRLINLRRFNGRPRVTIFSEEYERFLLDPHTLDSWAHLSLTERVKRIYMETKVSVSHSRLRRFYRKSDVTYTKPPTFVKYDIINTEKHQRLRQEYALVLASLIHNDAPIVYMDESSVSVTMRKERCWQHRTDPVRHPLNTKRHRGVTIMGAIGNALKAPCFTLAKSTNEEDFVAFMKAVKKKLKDPQQPTYLVYDGAAAHTSYMAQEYLDLHWLPLRFPSHSCRFNSIEHLWSPLKNQLRKNLLAHKAELSQEQWHELIMNTCAGLDIKTVEANIRSNRAYLAELLKD